MTDAPKTAVADPAPAATVQRAEARPSGNGRNGSGIIARGERQAAEAITAALADLGFSPRTVDLRPDRKSVV